MSSIFPKTLSEAGSLTSSNFNSLNQLDSGRSSRASALTPSPFLTRLSPSQEKKLRTSPGNSDSGRSSCANALTPSPFLTRFSPSQEKNLRASPETPDSGRSRSVSPVKLPSPFLTRLSPNEEMNLGSFSTNFDSGYPSPVRSYPSAIIRLSAAEEKFDSAAQDAFSEMSPRFGSFVLKAGGSDLPFMSLTDIKDKDKLKSVKSNLVAMQVFSGSPEENLSSNLENMGRLSKSAVDDLSTNLLKSFPKSSNLFKLGQE